MTWTDDSVSYDFGHYALIVDTMARNVAIFADPAAADRRASRDWRRVSRELRRLGQVTIESGYIDGSVDVLAGTY